jgi:hypothetical protein
LGKLGKVLIASEFILLDVILVSVIITGVYSCLTDPAQNFAIVGENIMKNIEQPQALSTIRASIDNYFGEAKQNYTLKDLFGWQNAHLKWGSSFWWIFGRSTNPRDILSSGVGRCQEYSILFTAACLSAGYEARIATVTKSDYTYSPHGFLEVKLNGTWTQVDSSAHTPTELVINNTSVYQGWDWWPLGDSYSIFTFDQNHAYNVTSNYIH